jgi:hypothetical protein
VNTNENTRRQPGARESNWISSNQSHREQQSKDFEDRRNAAACFKNVKAEDWHADYKGVLVTEELPAGTKCWVNVYIRTTSKGDKYLSVVLKPQTRQ